MPIWVQLGDGPPAWVYRRRHLQRKQHDLLQLEQLRSVLPDLWIYGVPRDVFLSRGRLPPTGGSVPRLVL